MAIKRILLLASIFLSLISLHQVRGRPFHVEGSALGNQSNQSNDSFSSSALPFIARYHLDAVQDPNSVGHWAIYESIPGEYYGTKAKMNVYGVPDIKPKQISSAEIWVANGVGGPPENLNTVQAGWQVNPAVYGDNDVHLFTYWTADGYKSTGCYNLHCNGFVVANSSSRNQPGRKLAPVSIYGGNQYWIELRIQKDPQSGDWWLYRDDGEDRGAIGYWPKSLFTSLVDKASMIEWGGYTESLKDEKSPPMGSGHFSVEDKEGAYFADINYLSSDGHEIVPIDGQQTPYMNREDCYRVGAFFNTNEHGGDEGCKFFYGGAGGCTN